MKVTVDAKVAAAMEEAKADDDGLERWSDALDPEEKAAKQRVILESYETLKKGQDDAHACNKAFEEQWHHIVGISIEQAPIEGACCLMEDKRRRLHEEEREHRSLASAMRKERRAQENRRREPERDHRAHRRIASRIQATPSFHSTCNI
jgi:hypothetical protein